MIIFRASQMHKTRTQYVGTAFRRAAEEVPHRNERRWAWVRLSFGFIQMFGAVFSVTLLVYTGVSVLTLSSVIVTGVFTTVSILLFGTKRSKRGAS